MKQAQASSKTQVWRTKHIANKKQPSANIQMAFLLPSEFRASADQEVYLDFDESEYEEIVAKLTVVHQAIFDKPVNTSALKSVIYERSCRWEADEQDVGGRRCICQSYGLH